VPRSHVRNQPQHRVLEVVFLDRIAAAEAALRVLDLAAILRSRSIEARCHIDDIDGFRIGIDKLLNCYLLSSPMSPSTYIRNVILRPGLLKGVPLKKNQESVLLTVRINCAIPVAPSKLAVASAGVFRTPLKGFSAMVCTE